MPGRLFAAGGTGILAPTRLMDNMPHIASPADAAAADGLATETL